MDTKTIQSKLIVALQALVELLKKQVPVPQNQIFAVARASLHTHITLDNTVDPALGCAEAVSFVLRTANVSNFPPAGFAGTGLLYTWLKKNFNQVTEPLPGDVIISPSGMSSKGDPHGHTGIVAQYGVLSNDSDTGLFMEKYTLASWKSYFGDKLGFPVYFFRPKS